jgi:uncharacterized protein (DUF1778 family)
MTQPARTDRRRKRESRKDDVIQIRASAATKAILNRAATLRGQKLSVFMLEQRAASGRGHDPRSAQLLPR